MAYLLELLPPLPAVASLENLNNEHFGSFFDYIGIENALISEFIEAMLAMEIAFKNNWTHVCLESDSLLVVKAFFNNNLVPWDIRAR